MARILLTNDDGIHAPGLKSLETIFNDMPDVECWTVAPNTQRSACSHSMSLGKPISVTQLGPRRFAHSGVVADGVYFGIVHLLAGNPPDVVVSGINLGANLAEDVIYSGTVAGAREAVLRKVHGLSVSLVDGDDFSYAAPNAVRIAIALSRADKTTPLLLNLNYPVGQFDGPLPCALGHRPYRPLVRVASAKNPDTFLLGGPPVPDASFADGTDVALIAAGIASLTPLSIDQTAHAVLNENRFSFLKN